MIELHRCVSARSFRPLWMLEEIGAPYALTVLPFPPRVLAHAPSSTSIRSVPSWPCSMATCA